MTSNKLRILCAESLGWTGFGNVDSTAMPGGKVTLNGSPPGNPDCFAPIPDPEHNDTDALALVHRAREQGKQVQIIGHPEGWNVVFGISVATDPDLRKAIVLAWLKKENKL